MELLSGEELIKLIQSVFPKFPGDKKLGILVDIPHEKEFDNQLWLNRRKIAEGWFHEIKDKASALGLDQIALIAYRDVENNNADLPEFAFFIDNRVPDIANQLPEMGSRVSFEDIFKNFQLFLAPTEFSTTAPLKNAAKIHGFRAATMPGFSPEMIPALRIDYNEVFRRVNIVKEKVDVASWAEVIFVVDNKNEFRMFFDLRFRTSHLSSGRFPEKGIAGNLPSGETYIVPYEGEKEGKSLTEGILPVQLGSDMVFFTIKENRAVEVTGEGESVNKEKDHLLREPAYGNMAELGFGVLGDFGLTPINEILLDEKLGFHVAFGRSDHFGGNVGPKDFSSPKAVIHLDQIYIPETQPRVLVKSIIFGYEKNDGSSPASTEKIMENGRYLIF